MCVFVFHRRRHCQAGGFLAQCWMERCDRARLEGKALAVLKKEGCGDFEPQAVLSPVRCARIHVDGRPGTLVLVHALMLLFDSRVTVRILYTYVCMYV